MTLLKHVRIIHREAREAARLSHIHVDVIGAGKHLALRFRSPSGKRRRLAVSSSPSNTHTAVLNTLKQARRIIGELTDGTR